MTNKVLIVKIKFLIRILITILVLFISITLLWMASWKISQYRSYQQIDKLIGQALQLDGRPKLYDPWNDLSPLSNPTARMIAQQALTETYHLINAGLHDPTVLRQQGQLALLLNQPNIAISAFSSATAIQPESSLRWFELGMAYERLDPSTIEYQRQFWIKSLMKNSQDSNNFVDTFTSLNDDEYLIYNSNYTWNLPNISNAQPDWWSPLIEIRRAIYFTKNLSFQVSLPSNPTMLILWIGYNPEQPESRNDKVVYWVKVNEMDVLRNSLYLGVNNRGWYPVLVDLTPWVGQYIYLDLGMELHTDAENHSVGWSEPYLVSTDYTPCIINSCKQLATEAWRRAGFTVHDFLQAGNVLQSTQRYKEAFQWYRRAILLEPKLADGWYYAGLTIQQMHSWEESIRLLQQAINIDGMFAKAYIAQARAIAFGYNRYDEAISIMRKGLEVALINQNREALIQGAQLFLELQSFTQAEELFRLYLSSEPNDLYAWLGLGQSLFGQRRFSEALEAFEQAARIQTGDWQDAMARGWLGNTYLALGRPYDAIREYYLAIQIHPNDSYNLVRLGIAYELVGEREEALKLYQQALSISPENDIAQKRIIDLQGEK